jgi:CRISPR-associated endonuclease/helicase Cas3
MHQPWGKLERGPEGRLSGRRLGLVEHCCDVVAVFEALLALPTYRRMLERAAGRALSRSDLTTLSAVVLLHDMGKCNWGFQAKEDPGAPRTAGHVREVAGLIGSGLHTRLLAFAQSGEGWRTSRIAQLVLAAISHHGDPIRAQAFIDQSDRFAPLWRPLGGYDPLMALADLASFAEERFGAPEPDAFDWLVIQGEDEQPAAGFTHLFAGLVSLADWIASNADDGFFPYAGHSAGDRLDWARERAREVIGRMTLETSALRQALQKNRPSFQSLFALETASAVQTHAETALEGPIICVEAPTGSGKTEAALLHFIRLFEAGAVDGLYFALPMRTAARQIHQRLQSFVERAWPAPGPRPNVVLAVPGYFREGRDEGVGLPGHEVLWRDRDEGERSDLAFLRWAAEHPKRALAATIAAGTIDQALLSVLQTRHAHLRGAAISRCLLVIDEVHASDAFQTELTRALLGRHVALGGRALLLSATLTHEARARLLHPAEARPDRLIDDDADYPCLSRTRGPRIDLSHTGPGKEVFLTCLADIDRPEVIAARAIAAARDGARVLIVRNSVKGVLAVQAALEAQAEPDNPLLFRASGLPTPHHGRYCAQDREILDAAVEARFGKGAPDRGGCVLVGSQTLEISLDCDADLMITDLCPADVLLQRLGRLHRHAGRARPAGFERAHAYVLTPENRDLSRLLGKQARSGHGLGTVYPDVLMLDLTWAELIARPVWTTPQDNRAIVQGCIGARTLDAEARRRGGDWRNAQAAGIGGRQAQRQSAMRMVLDWSTSWNEQPWAGDLGDEVATRLGLRAHRIRLSSPAATVFGAWIDTLDLPGWLRFPLPAPDPTQTVEVQAQADGTLTFDHRGLAFRYGRWGLET